MFHQWLVADDFDACSDAAARVACQLAVNQGQATGQQGRVVLCHVVQPVPLVMAPDVMGMPDMVATLSSTIEDAGVRLQERAQALQEAFPTLKIQTSLPSGPAVKTILEEADRQRVDAICVGSHGTTGLAHALLGSTAERTVYRSHKTVLVVKSPPAVASRELGSAARDLRADL